MHALTDATHRALARAVSEIEQRSSAEVVVSVRARSGEYGHVAPLSGAIAAVATLAFLLFSPWVFAMHWVFIDPVLLGILVAFTAGRLGRVTRALTPAASRRAAVESAARACFFERELRRTAQRTGLLVYWSALEGDGVVLADTGVLEAVEPGPWKNASAALLDALRAQRPDAELVKAMDELGHLLALALPRGVDDVNELPDEVDRGA